MEQQAFPFWSLSPDQLLRRLQSSAGGLSGSEAERRLDQYGPNSILQRKRPSTGIIFLKQFKSPIIIILIFAAILSLFLGEPTEAIIILVIVFFSGLLGFWQEKGAANVMDNLLAIVEVKTIVLRDGKQAEIPIEDVVPGDIIVLSAGATIPGDCLILESSDLFVDESALSGETFPAEKEPAITPEDTPLAQRTSALFMGTHVVSGSAKAIVARTGRATEFGRISQRLKAKPKETEFEHGVRHFGYLLMEVTIALIAAIFLINVALHRPVLDSFLFSLALAVGLTPQLLPAIISVNLAQGARQMAAHKVIVKQLQSIENFGSMNVFCSDKTGTLTEGRVQLNDALDINGNKSHQVLLYAYINSYYETGFRNPIDDAIRERKGFDVSGYSELDEIPYDFVRKRLSILAINNGQRLLITKGAFQQILEVCSKAETPDGKSVPIAAVRDRITSEFETLSEQGYRTLGIAYKDVGGKERVSKEDESDMAFLGYITFFDPPKEDAADTIRQLEDLGITLKVITGDNRLVAISVGKQVGLEGDVLTGRELNRISDQALENRASGISIFAEIEPNQKERIILALKRSGNVVGYMGDGINDAPALHAADVGISVRSAVDVARDAAEIVLLEQDLGVLAQGVEEGRVTFANTLKYVFMATSANFGNMFSMAGASLFLSFLPLLPSQVLLTNLLTDLPEMTIATDNVDSEMIDKPRRWDINFILKFMLTFGPLSSVFDYMTFGLLILILHSSPQLFRTGWFIESVISASLIVLVIRTRKPFFLSRPSKYLGLATLLMVIITIAIPLTPLAEPLGFERLPLTFYPALGAIVVLYIFFAELTKRIFYARLKF
ncbi:MAG: magnesium-translocating P-type ATPase [Actinobacteria bacterium RBG_19FT_COMBO_54_7]|uniref:Magnesium-transporting ATPase, P-type 1 n=1 Tax=Candidatus Solincola sediminis TaxID=1797199 RepID=A0A1F2WNM9_9ACTN|nr:MAG: magnesium-translocating P-type ATPase [Candidatus Solincola sediminis]OFW59534.1 MAG: magnesium-translocating P-type ATPase [Candidatus Solincola sediminis]OFW68721.1 MAG: magnesium-translocating P-type ATPase [Actinobacteria bacterium RBG_19FT_COMBO_54_7]